MKTFDADAAERLKTTFRRRLRRFPQIKTALKSVFICGICVNAFVSAAP